MNQLELGVLEGLVFKNKNMSVYLDRLYLLQELGHTPGGLTTFPKEPECDWKTLHSTLSSNSVVLTGEKNQHDRYHSRSLWTFLFSPAYDEGSTHSARTGMWPGPWRWLDKLLTCLRHVA